MNVDPKRRPNVRTLLRHPFIKNEKISNPQSKEFFGVEMISDNFKNFFNKFTVDKIEEQKMMLSKNTDSLEEQNSSQIRLSEDDISLPDQGNNQPYHRISRMHTNKSTVIRFYDGKEFCF